MSTPTLVVRPYFSHAFDKEWMVVPMDTLDRLGLMDRDPSHTIYAHLDGLRPREGVRFKTKRQADRYLVNRLHDEGRARAEALPK